MDDQVDAARERLERRLRLEWRQHASDPGWCAVARIPVWDQRTLLQDATAYALAAVDEYAARGPCMAIDGQRHICGPVLLTCVHYGGQRECQEALQEKLGGRRKHIWSPKGQATSSKICPECDRATYFATPRCPCGYEWDMRP